MQIASKVLSWVKHSNRHASSAVNVFLVLPEGIFRIFVCQKTIFSKAFSTLTAHKSLRTFATTNGFFTKGLDKSKRSMKHCISVFGRIRADTLFSLKI